MLNNKQWSLKFELMPNMVETALTDKFLLLRGITEIKSAYCDKHCIGVVCIVIKLLP